MKPADPKRPSSRAPLRDSRPRLSRGPNHARPLRICKILVSQLSLENNDRCSRLRFRVRRMAVGPKEAGYNTLHKPAARLICLGGAFKGYRRAGGFVISDRLKVVGAPKEPTQFHVEAQIILHEAGELCLQAFM